MPGLSSSLARNPGTHHPLAAAHSITPDRSGPGRTNRGLALNRSPNPAHNRAITKTKDAGLSTGVLSLGNLQGRETHLGPLLPRQLSNPLIQQGCRTIRAGATPFRLLQSPKTCKTNPAGSCLRPSIIGESPPTHPVQPQPQRIKGKTDHHPQRLCQKALPPALRRQPETHFCRRLCDIKEAHHPS